MPTLTTALAAHHLTVAQARRRYPIHLRAVVTYFDPYIDQRHAATFVADSSRSIFVALENTSGQALVAGDLVDLTGVSGPGDYSPIVDHAHARVIGKAQLPSEAPRVGKSDMLDAKTDAEWVEVEGVIHGVHAYGNNEFIDLALEDGDITAITVKEAGADYERLVDSRIILRGDEAPMFNHKRQMTGAHMFFPTLRELRMVDNAPVHPFNTPIKRVADLLLFTAEAGLHHRDHIRGVVTLFWPGRMLCIEDASGGLCAQLDRDSIPKDQASRPSDQNQVEPRPGSIVDAIGFPVTGEFTPALLNTTFQLVSSAGERPISAIAISATEAINGDHDAELVTMEGRLIGYDRAASDPTLMLAAGNYVFPVVLPQQSAAAAFGSLQEGSLVRVAGICSVQADRMISATGNGFSVGKTFRILLQSPAGITLIRQPSWWNAAHAVSLFAVALLVAVGALACVIILRHRVQQQTRIIRESEERYRHLATHDGLTKLPNRTTVLEALDRTIVQARQRGTQVCVALIDLDHFKSINDTLGHLAGDEVLREAARRLAVAVRSNDLVGRYGGEEFLIVFHDMDLETALERCEKVCSVLSGDPVCCDGTLITVTCSIGVAVAHSSELVVPVLVARADEAMYEAKSRGRNRVVTLQRRGLPCLIDVASHEASQGSLYHV